VVRPLSFPGGLQVRYRVQKKIFLNCVSKENPSRNIRGSRVACFLETQAQTSMSKPPSMAAEKKKEIQHAVYPRFSIRRSNLHQKNKLGCHPLSGPGDPCHALCPLSHHQSSLCCGRACPVYPDHGLHRGLCPGPGFGRNRGRGLLTCLAGLYRGLYLSRGLCCAKGSRSRRRRRRRS